MRDNSLIECSTRVCSRNKMESTTFYAQVGTLLSPILEPMRGFPKGNIIGIFLTQYTITDFPNNRENISLTYAWTILRFFHCDPVMTHRNL